ncbi:MAG: PQQ-binding-like beta-propeller repeat protein [Bacteroidales bacterium]
MTGSRAGMIIAVGCMVFSAITDAQVTSEWRGPGRSGIYPEKNLLKQWPEGGPQLLWSRTDLPKGYSSLAIGNERLFLTGLQDSMDVLTALDLHGNVLWQSRYGRAWNGSYPESRSTPTIEGNRLYVSSGYGDLACLDASTGKLIWSVKTREQFDGSVGRWGIAESPLLHEDKVFFTCGGSKTTLVALDKSTGEVKWTTECLNETPSYVSPLLIKHGGKNQVVAVTENTILAVNPGTGNIEWKFNYGEYKPADARNNHSTTPLFADGRLYMSSGYNHYSVMLQLNQGATAASLVWVDSTLDVHLGGVVKVDNYIFGSNWLNNGNGNWACLDWNTGKTMYETKWHNKGSIISADGMLYCYEEKSGNLALVRPTPVKFDIVSSFKLSLGTGPHWAHPVISNGVLYVRHGEALMAFNLTGK